MTDTQKNIVFYLTMFFIVLTGVLIDHVVESEFFFKFLAAIIVVSELIPRMLELVSSRFCMTEEKREAFEAMDAHLDQLDERE